MLLQYLLANGAKRINLDHFPRLGRGHTKASHCGCNGKGHDVSRLDLAKEWAEERGLKIVETPSGEVVAI